INPLLESRFAHEGAVQELAISPDGKLLASAAEDGTLKFWDAAALRELSSEQLTDDLVTAMTFVGQPARLLLGTSAGQLLNRELPSLSVSSSAAQPMAVASPPPGVATGTVVPDTAV